MFKWSWTIFLLGAPVPKDKILNIIRVLRWEQAVIVMCTCVLLFSTLTTCKIRHHVFTTFDVRIGDVKCKNKNVLEV